MDDGNPWIAILVTIVLVAINGILASAEIALVGLNEAKLKHSAENGHKKHRLLLKMKQNPSDFLSTIQIGITLVGLLSGALAADSLAEPIVAWAKGLGASGFMLSLVNVGAVVLITLLLTFVMLVFGELVPKRVAMANPEKTALRFVSLIHGLGKVTRPLVKLLAASTNGVLRLIGINPAQVQTPVTEQEILIMLREGQAQGTIEETEVEVVSNLFEFTDLTVEEAMTHRTEIRALPADSSLMDFAALLSESGFSKFPVYEETIDRIVGVIYSADVMKLLPLRLEETALPAVRDVMRPPFFVPETKPLHELFQEIKRDKQRLAVVVDEYGGTSGIITVMDIIEEIVGDIEVDYLPEQMRGADGTYTMDGRMDMEDVRDLINLMLDDDEEEYDTLSGFLIDQLGYIPAAGDAPYADVDGFRFQVVEMNGALIQTVRIEELPEEAPEALDADEEA